MVAGVRRSDQVDDRVARAHRRAVRGRLERVADDDGGGCDNAMRGRRPREYPRTVAAIRQRRHQRPADVSRAAGDEDIAPEHGGDDTRKRRPDPFGVPRQGKSG
jgi:hypothetical protein